MDSQPPPSEGSEKPKLSLYQRIQAATAAVNERDIRERPERQRREREEKEKREREEQERKVSEEREQRVLKRREQMGREQAIAAPPNPNDAGQEESQLMAPDETQPAQEDQIHQSAVPILFESDKGHSEQDPEDRGYVFNKHQDESEDEHGNNPKNTKTLAEMAEIQILNQLKKAVTGYQSTANYCCGGTIPISTIASQANSELPETSKAPITSPPPVLRWDVPGINGLSKRVQFPLSSEVSDSTSTLDDLVAACAPATFGFAGEDVLDETYRKAGKLDRSQFSTDFHPHDYGIIDAISQILLPDFRGPGMEDREEHRGVLAELYKLNIYSSPSGMFHAHVDTPRRATQFGSLVVCLPHPHAGGQLRVSHKGHSTFFNWSNNESNAIQWAAFYSDCEHEVLSVKAGHRITITYNLYVTEQIGGVIQRFPTADAALSPLYEGAKQMLEQPGFMKDGGVIGFYCAHQYAHSRNTSIKTLMPYALKGIDIALFSVFKSLGLKITVRPVMHHEDFTEYDGSLYEEYERSFYTENWRTGERSYKDTEAWKNRLAEDEFWKQQGVTTRAGQDFHSIKIDHICPKGEDAGVLVENIQWIWPFDEYKDVIFLNQPAKTGDKGWELAYVGMRYGNDASLTWSYSHAVVFIEVPSRAERTMVGASVN